MPSAKLSQLPVGTAVQSTDLFYSDQAMLSVQQPASALKTFIGPGATTTNFAHFGGVGDGITDNSTAWNAFATFARAQSSAGVGVQLTIDPGTYNYDHSLCQQFLQNIKRLHVIGYGAVIQNTYDGSIRGHNASFEWSWGPACQPVRDAVGNSLGFLISSTTPGTNTVTLLTPSQTSNFVIGDWVMIASLDIQYTGFPPNMDQFEFSQITNINAGTGLVTLDRNLRYQHLSTFPDGGNTTPGGKARIWQLNSSGWPIGKVTWDIEHVYEGLQINNAPNTVVPYQIFTGRKIKTINWDGAGPSESIAGTVEHYTPKFITQGEPDKQVGNILYSGMTWDVNARIAFQSSSIDNVRIVDSVINNLLQTGAKFTTVENSILYGMACGPTQGFARNTIARNCQILNGAWVNDDIGVFLPSSVYQIDGINITFSNGVFSILKSFVSIAAWNVVIGQLINLAANVNIFNTQAYSFDAGTGVVVSLTEDATHLIIGTTLPFAVLPVWASGFVRIIRQGETQYDNCTGCDPVRVASEARRSSKSARELFKYRWLGLYDRGGGWFEHIGNLLSLKFNVRTAAPTAGTMQITVENANYPAMTDAGLFDLTINTAIAGLRTITQSAFTGAQAGDGITLNSVGQSALPVGVIWVGQSSWALSWNPASFAPYQNPVIDMELQFDSSMLTIETTSKFDESTSTAKIANTAGSLP